ncbi:hypothetical protein P280DRAFT_514887 [Massarina eburnea CBS 473.64]|uniref:DUF4188 domain-containing protein n=1 Tax=Massarina eburnea CBS 473.64 TaxID=1395130 RepID=A0A6A6S9I8_9PLEO|nr:hypothetical protein P280DRAFT_514887 [Massarina eburnea CBS 473.64]
MSFSERYEKKLFFIHNVFLPTTYRVSTWICLGAVLQLLSLLCLPIRVSILIPVSVILYRLVYAAVRARDVYTTSFTDVRKGRWRTQLPAPDESINAGSDSDGVVIFILGSRINHPQGRIAANALPVGKMFMAMWEEAETNREQWGYLGHTATLGNLFDHEGNTQIWISYWKTLEGLHEFAKCAVHQDGQMAYIKDDSFQYVGIMHETYFARRDSFESINYNFPPFGIGATRWPVDKSKDLGLIDPLVKDGPKSTMFSRMGRKT